MDFSGANALYFWELFYYTPMMVATRLLQEQNFTEANRWLSYIWQPAASGAGDWRVRPLKEDTSGTPIRWIRLTGCGRPE